MKWKDDKTESTFWARIYLSGPIDVAKQVLRSDCLREGLCVTIEPTLFIYTGGEESGYVVGLIQYPRFPKPQDEIRDRAYMLAEALMVATHQHSALVMDSFITRWVSRREQ